MKPSSNRQLVSTRERPDLAPLVTSWLWQAFWRDAGYSLAQTLQAVQHSATATPMPRTFILLVEGQPVGTASLAAHDLDQRPDLSPWLAGVFVEPAARGNGYAFELIDAVENEARSLSVETLWLYTRTAEALYVRVGWQRVETLLHRGEAVALMRRTLPHLDHLATKA